MSAHKEMHTGMAEPWTSFIIEYMPVVLLTERSYIGISSFLNAIYAREDALSLFILRRNTLYQHITRRNEQ